ncbi:hypothetical protein HU200_036479 [Digitaria exilis]|uniref:Uncharacterized protein n=1 Tax=Digitaria exilis TaxID=1010633 RepID=A0A835EKY1_9POAL|nr:hypothetical protein HU200_036479 [Digitaria exilis]
MGLSGGGHRGDDGETEAPSDPKLPPPMAGVTKDLLPSPMARWRMSGYAGPAWPWFSDIYVAIDGEEVGSKLLPFEVEVEGVDEDISEREIRRHVGSRAMEDVKQWRLALRIPVRLDWPHESLDIHMERIDYDPRWRKTVVTRGGPTPRATPPDGDEEEAEDKKKRRRNSMRERLDTKLEGTVEFGKTVPLLVWEMSPLQDTVTKPQSVVRGTVDGVAVR